MIRLWYYFKRKTKQRFKPVILVTGCGSGIGLALANLLSQKEEYRLVITARKKTLEKLKTQFQESDRLILRELDVVDENSRIRLINEIQEKWGGVNILINNAGISYRAVLEHMEEADEYKQMATNYLGPIGLTRLVLPQMRAIGRGKIINISSVSGMMAMPTMASYSASKYALEGASEALWYECRPFGIDVSLIQPGFIHSQSFENVYHSRLSDPANCTDQVYCDIYDQMRPFIAKLMKYSWATPEKIANLTLKVIRTEGPPLWIAATFDALVFYYVRRMLPRRIILPFLFYFLPGSKTWGKKHTKKREW